VESVPAHRDAGWDPATSNDYPMDSDVPLAERTVARDEKVPLTWDKCFSIITSTQFNCANLHGKRQPVQSSDSALLNLTPVALDMLRVLDQQHHWPRNAQGAIIPLRQHIQHLTISDLVNRTLPCIGTDYCPFCKQSHELTYERVFPPVLMVRFRETMGDAECSCSQVLLPELSSWDNLSIHAQGTEYKYRLHDLIYHTGGLHWFGDHLMPIRDVDFAPSSSSDRSSTGKSVWVQTDSLGSGKQPVMHMIGNGKTPAFCRRSDHNDRRHGVILAVYVLQSLDRKFPPRM
jgi:hypothetical protein